MTKEKDKNGNLTGKRIFEKFLFACFSLFLIQQSYSVLTSIEHFQFSSWWANFLAAWVLNMFVTGIFAFAVFGFPVERFLPKAYYTVYNPKRLKQVYQKLNVEAFRQALLATLWKSQKQRQKYFNGKSDGIENLVVQSMKSEFGHLLPFAILTLASIYILYLGLIQLGVFTMLFNIIGNFYPVILQRYHRMRIQRIRARFEKV